MRQYLLSSIAASNKVDKLPFTCHFISTTEIPELANTLYFPDWKVAHSWRYQVKNAWNWQDAIHCEL